MGSPRQFTAVLVLALVVCVVATPASAGTSVTDSNRAALDSSDRGVSALTASAAAQNNSTQHENPDEALEDGDEERVEGWLTDRLSQRLEESTIQLSQGEYETAREYVGDDYSERVEQLVDVEGETDGGDGENDSSSRFERARETQNEYVTSVQEYHETRERYETAKENGNQTEARRLARRLNELANGINDTGTTLTRDYENVSTTSGRDLSDGIQTVENITTNITLTQQEIREVEFRETNLSVDLRSSNVSFLDPIDLTGRVTTANGTALENETVELQFGDRTTRVTTNGSGEFELSGNGSDDLRVTVTDDGDVKVAVNDSATSASTTNESGTFRVTHRPTVQRLDESTATVRFVPAADSVYLGTEQTVTVDVEQVTPTVSIDEGPTAVGFNDTTTVNGSVAVDGVSAAGVPVVVGIGDTQIGVARTDANGEFSLTTRLPADVPAGSQTINASLPLRNRALASAAAERSVTVLETDTSLTLSTTVVDDERVRAVGTLLADGTPVGNRTIELRMNGSVVSTARTDGQGRYNATASVPAATLEDGTVQVTVTYADEGSNLGDARAEEVLVLDAASDSVFPVDWRLAVAVGVFVTGAVAGGVSLWRRRRSSDAPAPSDVAAETTERLDPDELSLDTVGALDAATAALEEGRPDRAVELVYGDVRRRVGEVHDIHSGRTHWEFYQACRAADVDGDAVTTLERLTEAYERAAYAPESLTRDEADAVIDAASEVRL